jgi:hypothetical protein
MLARLPIVTVALALLSAGASAATWHDPATLRTCAPASDPKVVFPFSAPSTRSGRGAILWLGPGPGCAGSRELDWATLHTDDEPSIPRIALGGPKLTGPLEVTSTTAGQVVAVVGASAQPSGAQPAAILGEGLTGGTLGQPVALGGPAGEVAAADGYIGDADVASTTTIDGDQAIELRAQRHYAHSFAPPVVLREGPAPISSLTLALDFRADAIAVWASGGEVRAQWVSNAGGVSQPQVLGPAGYAPRIAAVLSDDDRAFVIWADQPAPGSSAPTTVYLIRSGNNVIFSHPPRALASFVQPSAQRLGPGSVALVRMTPSEGVLAAWPLLQGGDYAVSAAGLTSTQVLPPATIAQPGADLRLAAIATGPHNDAVVVLERAPRASSGFDETQQAILAARSVPGGPGGVAFGAPAQLAVPGPNRSPSVAIDPNSDRAVVVWKTLVGGQAEIAYDVTSTP